jgi:uncharacterized protein
MRSNPQRLFALAPLNNLPPSVGGRAKRGMQMSCCDKATVTITNNSKALLTVRSISIDKGKLEGISIGDAVLPNTSLQGTASSTTGSKGAAIGEIGIIISSQSGGGTEKDPIVLGYNFTPKDNLGKCPCTTTGGASPNERGRIGIDVTRQNCDDDKKSKAGIAYSFVEEKRDPRSAIIVGAGAGGIFSAYELTTRKPDLSVILLEARDRIGGNVESVTVTVDTPPPPQSPTSSYEVVVDAGAQFFSQNAQPNYCQLIETLGLNNPQTIVSASAGVTIWDRTTDKLVFKIPAQLTAAYVLAHLDDFIDFGIFLYEACKLYKKGWEDETSVKDWVNGLLLIPSSFRTNAILPFLYQFDTVDPDTLNSCSAWYTVSYLVDSVHPETPGANASGGLFTVLNCIQGLQYILQQTLAATPVSPLLSTKAVSASWTGANWTVKSAAGNEYTAEALVFAIDGPDAAAVLTAGQYNSEVILYLSQLQFARLPITLQEYESNYMPGTTGDWEAVNILTSKTGSGALQYLFTVWFGALRPEVQGSPIPIFKSWGNPDFDPNAYSPILPGEHPVIVPTYKFLQARDEIADYQGLDGLWFAGAWTNWFDSQEAALNSAGAIADKMFPDRATARQMRAKTDLASRLATIDRLIIKPALAAVTDAKRRAELTAVFEALAKEIGS